MSDNLTILTNVKDDIKNAIINKGVTPTGGMVEYADCIRQIGEGAKLEKYTKFAYSQWEEVPQFILENINWEGLDDGSYMFYECNNLKSFPYVDTSNLISTYYMFYDTDLTTIPHLDLGNVRNISLMLAYCSKLTSVPLIDCSSVISQSPFKGTDTGSGEIFNGYPNLTYLGGFKNLKASWNHYFLNHLGYLTLDSVMNVINNLYDWSGNTDGIASLKDGTLYDFGTSHQLRIGKYLYELSDEQKAVATLKGWTLLS